MNATKLPIEMRLKYRLNNNLESFYLGVGVFVGVIFSYWLWN